MEPEKNSGSPLSPMEVGSDHVPDSYIEPPPSRPNPDLAAMHVPVIDLAQLHQSPHTRALVIDDIGKACKEQGFFQVINHGICPTVIDGALSSAAGFFALPYEQKVELESTDVKKPVRYCTSFKDGLDTVQFWRVFLKQYAHPLEEWVKMWPANPSDYREKMGKYAVEARRVALEVVGAILGSLGLGPTYMKDRLEDGMQIMTVNCYPPCPQPDLVLGLPPHSDYCLITVLLQRGEGLQVKDTRNNTWKMVPIYCGSIQVHVGDHLEVLSNGRYKTLMHRVALNSDVMRLSIASLHGLAMDDQVETADELVDEQRAKGYEASSFSDFLDFLSSTDVSHGKSYLDTLRITRT